MMMLSFQQTCGFEYTSKLERMFKDIGVSKDINERFKNSLTADPLDCECSCLYIESISTGYLMQCNYSFYSGFFDTSLDIWLVAVSAVGIIQFAGRG